MIGHKRNPIVGMDIKHANAYNKGKYHQFEAHHEVGTLFTFPYTDVGEDCHEDNNYGSRYIHN